LKKFINREMDLKVDLGEKSEIKETRYQLKSALKS